VNQHNPAPARLQRVINWDEQRDLVATFQVNRRVFYIGKWERHVDQFGDAQRSNTQFSAFEFSFYGPSVRWIGSKGPDHGFADVYVDGVLATTVDAYSPQPVGNVVKFERHDLAPDRLHTLRVVVRKERDAAATDCYQNVSFLEAEQPVCYPIEMARQRDAEYAVIQASQKPQADPSTWRRITPPARMPVTGVTLHQGPFRLAFERNIAYLRHCLASPTYCDGEGWSSWLPASNDGRMLAGAANTLRWEEHTDLRSFVSDKVAAIGRQARPDGYYNYYPEEDSYALNQSINSERKNYDRVFWTRGLLAAGAIGFEGAHTSIRRMYDWFNSSSYLPYVLLGGNATNGLPGGPLVHLSPVGKPDDLITTQRYYDQDYWMAQLSNGEALAMTYYPGERPHCYALLGYEAMVDEYVGTGDEKYLRAVTGGWQAYRDNFKHVGGTTSIMEHHPVCPPKALFVTTTKTGEACGSVFWIDINSKLLQLFPGEEKYAAEIEESLFNVMLAAQDERGYIRYHNHLSGHKQAPGCRNTCCEVTSISMIARVPELIYSLAADGIYLNQYIASRIEWQQGESQVGLIQDSRVPADGNVRLSVSVSRPTKFSLRLRVPSWAGDTDISVNGERIATGAAGSYVELARTWSDGDAVTYTLRMDYRTVLYEGVEQVEGNLDRHALLYGPVLMALTGSDEEIPRLRIDPADLMAKLPAPDDRLSVGLAEHPGYRYQPYWMVDTERFNCYPIVAR
jgi:hypothetical protein